MTNDIKKGPSSIANIEGSEINSEKLLKPAASPKKAR